MSTMLIHVKNELGQALDVDIESTAVVSDLKDKVFILTGWPVLRQRLIYAEHHDLQGLHTLAQYSIEDQATLHLAEANVLLPSGRTVSYLYFAHKRRRLCDQLSRLAQKETMVVGVATPVDWSSRLSSDAPWTAV